MVEYRPLDVPVDATFADTKVKMARWKDGAFFVDFEIGKSGSVLRASFSNPITVRFHAAASVVDLEPGEHVGASRDCIAYEASGSAFQIDHSFSLRDAQTLERHFRFLIRGECIDVLTTEEPFIRVVSTIQAANQ